MVLFFTLYQHVIYIYLDISFDLSNEHLVYEPLVCCLCILQSEWHELVTKKVLACDKRCLFLVRLLKLVLVLTRESIHEAQQLVSSR